MKPYEFAKAIKERKIVFGTCITMPSPHMVKFVGELGTDFLFIDTEHIPQSREKISWMCHAFEGKGQTPLVRIPSPDEFEASKMLDGGAMAILTPYTETVEQVKRLGGAVKLRPLKGEKLQKVLHGEWVLSKEEKAYLDEFNKDRLLFINIESTCGIGRLDDMLKTGYVDGVIIGPHDLSVSLGDGENYESDAFQKSVEKIIDICVRHDVSIGNHFSTSIEKQIAWCKLGMNMILNSSDMGSFVSTTQKEMGYIKSKVLPSSEVKQSQVII